MSQSNNPITFPDYDNSILSITASIAKYHGIPTPYKSNALLDTELSKGYKNVVLLIVDGLGLNVLTRHLPEESFLRQAYKETVSSIFPPTTTAATTTFKTGLPPISHGWFGSACYFKEFNQVITLFNNTNYYTNEKVPDFKEKMQQLAFIPIWEQINTRKEVQAHCLLPDKIDKQGLTSLHKMMNKIQTITESSGRQFIYAYWPEPDHTEHVYGPESEEVRVKMSVINRRIKRLHARLKDTLLIVTADHGQTAISDTILINDCGQMADCLSVPLSIEGRCASVFIKPDKKELFENEFSKYLAADFLLIPREEVFAAHLFGIGTPHSKVNDFIGDFLIVGITDKDLGQQIPNGIPIPRIKGAHAGLTRQEMQVPLIIAPSSDRK